MNMFQSNKLDDFDAYFSLCSDDYYQYIEGYKKSVYFLIGYATSPCSNVTDKHCLVFPIMFLAFHCIEIAMKNVIYECGGKQMNTHKLDHIYDKCLSSYIRFSKDKGFSYKREDFKDLDENMRAFLEYEYFKSAATFKYPQDTAGNLHFKKKPIDQEKINLSVFQSMFKTVLTRLEGLVADVKFKGGNL